MNGVDTNGTRTLRYRYTYDEANQITRVDDNIQSKTYVYQYDKGGNRVSEKIYAYTLSDTLGTVQQEIVSEYDNIVWDDLLTSYNGKEITYDNAGNPTSYDGKTYTWNGKQLTQITAADGSKTLFDYDANGLRSRKVQCDADGKLLYYVEYIWADGKIVSQYLTVIMYVTYNGSTKSVPIGPIPSKIIYDENGIPQGFTCGEATFGFVRNLQGDVIAMVDMEGNIVMEYSYDPWGNIEYHLNENVTTEEEALMITALCPLTYRGYNYDFTTGLYYLQSRYYNPEWGRFLNCDDTAILLATQGETHNANLFAYCANNPVNRVDYTGYDSEEIVEQVVNVLLITIVFGGFLQNQSDIDDHFYLKKENGLISIAIDIEKDDFYKVILNATTIDEDLTYLFLAYLVDDLVKENMKREMLFSVECMAYEIKWHVEKYHYSLLIDEAPPMFSDTVDLGAIIRLPREKLQAWLNSRCKTINIYEGDVYTWEQAAWFSYNEGIRECYKYTDADPYIDKLGIRNRFRDTAVGDEISLGKVLMKYEKEN